jgi:hypothetical protein
MDYLQRRDYFNQHVSIRIRHPVVRRNKESTRLVLVVPVFLYKYLYQVMVLDARFPFSSSLA